MTAKTKPAEQVVAITPSDSTVFVPPFRSLWFNVGGTIYVDAAGVGTNVKVIGQPGSLFPVEVTRVYSTGLSGAEVLGLR